jgi:hypothetical protein
MSMAESRSSARELFNKQLITRTMIQPLADVNNCRRRLEPPGEAEALFRFTPEGKIDYVRVVDVTYQATATADCIENRLLGLTTPAFSGEPRILRFKILVR